MEGSELVHLGWDSNWEDILNDLYSPIPAGGRVGRIVRVERGESDISFGEVEIRAVSDSLRAQSTMAPVTGDWVLVTPSEDDLWRVDEVLPRRTELVRRDPGERELQQPLSANIDLVFLVHGFDRPFRSGKLERFLVLGWNAGAEPIVVLTKADLASPEEIEELSGVVKAVAPEVKVIVASSTTQDGLEPIRSLLQPNRTGTLLGESGAGKSTLVNALLDDEVQETQEVRSGDAKGRHTTITRDLRVVPGGGILIDTPGIRAVGLWDAQDALERVFDDILSTGQECRFNDCVHGSEPKCAVRGAVESGELDSRRLERFALMAEELAESERRVAEREKHAQRRPRSRGRR